MSKLTAFLLFLLLYFLIGLGLFTLGVKGVGGKEEYLKSIKHRHPVYYEAAFKLARILVMLFWPYFYLKAIIERKQE